MELLQKMGLKEYKIQVKSKMPRYLYEKKSNFARNISKPQIIQYNLKH